jgi:menaquinone-9 beta-reductase
MNPLGVRIIFQNKKQMSSKKTNTTEESKKIDLIIVGAGPAGISTALHLLKIDPSWQKRMIVLEKQRHPRPKLCGGGLTTYGLKILQELGFSLPLPISQARVDDIRLHYKKRIVHGRGAPVFMVYRREELDALLSEEARHRGVVIHEDEVVNDIIVSEKGVLVHTNKACYLAQAVVGADGSKGIVRRKVAGRSNPTRVGRTLEIVLPSTEDAPPFSEEFAFFDFNPVQSGLQGYAWVFPSKIDGKPYYNLGVYDSGFYKKKDKAHLPEVLEKIVSTVKGEYDVKKTEGHPIHWFHPANHFSSSRLLLVGDAAGADPLLGEGIGPALGYGQTAAEAIQYAYEKADYSFKNYPRRILLSPVGQYLLIRWYIAWWSYRLCSQNWFMHTLWTSFMIAAEILPKPKITVYSHSLMSKKRKQIE